VASYLSTSSSRPSTSPNFAYLTIVLLAIAVGCKNNSNAPLSYEDIAGTYLGTAAGSSQGVTINARFTIAIMESAAPGVLGGSYSIAGTISESGVYGVQGTGWVGGNITAGNNPNVYLTFTFSNCPATPMTFGGTYNSSTGVIALTGPVYIFNGSCQVLLVLQGALLLTR
jgi:hypothetical protein